MYKKETTFWRVIKMPEFKKVSELSGEDRSKLKTYWSELWGPEFAAALTTDFKPEGKKQKVEAKTTKQMTK